MQPRPDEADDQRGLRHGHQRGHRHDAADDQRDPHHVHQRRDLHDAADDLRGHHEVRPMPFPHDVADATSVPRAVVHARVTPSVHPSVGIPHLRWNAGRCCAPQVENRHRGHLIAARHSGSPVVMRLPVTTNHHGYPVVTTHRGCPGGRHQTAAHHHDHLAGTLLHDHPVATTLAARHHCVRQDDYCREAMSLHHGPRTDPDPVRSSRAVPWVTPLIVVCRVSRAGDTPVKRRRGRSYERPLGKECPATFYSPTQWPAQYHRR